MDLLNEFKVIYYYKYQEIKIIIFKYKIFQLLTNKAYT